MIKIIQFTIATLALLGSTATAYGFLGDEMEDLIDQEEKNLSSTYNVCHEDKKLVRKAAITFKANLVKTSEDGKCLVMQLNRGEISKLKVFGFEISPAADWIEKRKRFLEKLRQKVMERKQLPKITSQESITIGAAVESIPGYDCYETVEGTFASAREIVENHPGLASWIDIGDSWEKENNMGGYDLMVLKLTNSETSGPKPILFINSAMHAREYATAPLALYFAKYLVDHYGNEADATWILNYHEIHILLQTNPDGRKYAETGLSWRKNANQNYCGATSRLRGADLNRNFSFAWNSVQGSSGNQCAADYRGPYAASEPETQALEAYVRSIFPDNRGPGPDDAAPDDTSGIHLDIHSYGGMVLWPWGTTDDAAPNGKALQTLGRKFAYWNNYSPLQSIGLYPTDGTTDGVSYGELGVPSFSFEIGTEFFENCQAFSGTIVPDNMPALLYAAKVLRSPYTTPSGPNSEDVTLSPSAVMPGGMVTVSALASDERFNTGNGTEQTQAINAAEYYIDVPPWETGAVPFAMEATDGAFNRATEEIVAYIDTTGLNMGRHTIFIRSRDAGNVWGAVSAKFFTISNTPLTEYCRAQGSNPDYTWIAGVQIGDLDNSSNAAGYSDFTSTVIDLEQGTHTVTLTPDVSVFRLTNYWKIFIDLDQDGVFTADEELFSANGTETLSGNLTIPAAALTGETRMRVVMSSGNDVDACGDFNYGEVEDYTVNILEGGSTSQNNFYYENTAPVAIADQSAVTSTIEVPQDAPVVDTVTVFVTVTHEDLGDLRIVVSKSDGWTVIKTRSYFDNSNGTATYSAVVDSSDISSFSGTWTLTVTDHFRGDEGTLKAWHISN